MRWLVASLTFLFFFLSSAYAQAPYEKQEIKACGGQNLVTGLSTEKQIELQRAAEAIPNSEGVFWKIEKPGMKPSWLLGTLHATDARVLNLKAPILEALNKADRVILELAETGQSKSEQANFNLFILENMNLGMYSDGQTLETETPINKREKIKAVLEGRGLSFDLLFSVKPWLISIFLETPKCEKQRAAAGLPFLDAYIGQTARANGVPVLGLETMNEQLLTLATLPPSVQFEMLSEVSPTEEMTRDMFATLVDYYLMEKIGYITELDRFLSDEPTSEEIRALFINAMLTKRNHNMAERMTPFLEEGNSFIAVGAAHLTDKDGLIELLRQKGYQLTRVPLTPAQ